MCKIYTLTGILRVFGSSRSVHMHRGSVDSLVMKINRLNSESNSRWKTPYRRENLRNILRDHKDSRGVTDKGEIAVRDNIDAILDFFGRLEYLLELKLIKDTEVSYFDYFLDKARSNAAIERYVQIYPVPLYQKLLARRKKTNVLQISS